MYPNLPVLLIVIAAALACASPQNDPVIAIWNKGEIRQSDLDREIEFMTQDERQYREIHKMAEDRVRTDLIRRIALRDIAERDAASTGIDRAPETRERARQAAREWWLSRWRETCYGLPLDVPGDDELRAELQERSLPKRVRLSHVFLRADGREEVAAARAKLEMWRQTITGLDDFASLARQHSQSESRHRDGRLGWIRGGWLSADAERVLFALPAGTVSPPIELRGGVHLFYIEAVREPGDLPLDRRLKRLRAEKSAAALNECRRNRLAAAEIPFESPPSGDWPPVTVGDWSIDGETLRIVYQRPDLEPAEVHSQWIEDEVLYQTALAIGIPTEGELRRLTDLEGNVLLGQVVEAKLERAVREPSLDELRSRFEDNPTRYKTQRQLEVEVLWTTIPPGADPLGFWDRLEEIADRLRSGSTTFEETATAIGDSATTQRWPMAPVREVASALGPPVFERVKNGEPGDVFGPIQESHRFWLVAVLGEEVARAATFDQAAPRLRAEILRERRAAARSSIVAEMLDTGGFRLTADHVEMDANEATN